MCKANDEERWTILLQSSASFGRRWQRPPRIQQQRRATVCNMPCGSCAVAASQKTSLHNADESISNAALYGHILQLRLPDRPDGFGRPPPPEWVEGLGRGQKGEMGNWGRG